jgi:hypothetical protein
MDFAAKEPKIKLEDIPSLPIIPRSALPSRQGTAHVASPHAAPSQRDRSRPDLFHYIRYATTVI